MQFYDYFVRVCSRLRMVLLGGDVECVGISLTRTIPSVMTCIII